MESVIKILVFKLSFKTVDEKFAHLKLHGQNT